MIRRSFGWIVIASLLTAPFAIAQSDEDEFVKSIRGVVRDLAGHPVSDARVFIFTEENNQTRILRTDEEGQYAIYGLPGDLDYQLHVTFQGLESESRTVTGLLARADNIVNFTLDLILDGVDDEEDGLTFESFDGVTLYGVFDLPVGVPAPIPVALLLHGYGETHAVWSALRDGLLSRGWAVLAIDLRGHGRSRTRGGTTLVPDESWREDPQQFPLDLQPALDYLKTRPRLDTNRIAVIGSDVGASLALIASGRYREVATAVAIDPDLDEALAMAGTARDFAPQTTQVIVADTETGERIRDYVKGASRLTIVDPPPRSERTEVWLGTPDTVDEILRWLRDTY